MMDSIRSEPVSPGAILLRAQEQGLSYLSGSCSIVCARISRQFLIIRDNNVMKEDRLLSQSSLDPFFETYLKVDDVFLDGMLSLV